MTSTVQASQSASPGGQSDLLTARIRAVARGLPHQPWGIGSRFDDLVVFVRALLASPEVHALLAPATAAVAAPVGEPDKIILDRLLEIARVHGEDSEPEHEVGDLQDLLRAAWGQLTSVQRRNFLALSAVSDVLEGAMHERLVSSADEVEDAEWDATRDFFGLDGSFQYAPADVVDYVNRYRLTAGTSPDGQGRYVHGTWGHFFEIGQPQRMIRFAFDRTTNQLVALEVRHGSAGRWHGATSEQRAHVLDSLINGNEDALTNPEDFGLDAGDELPDWTQSAGVNAKPYRVLLADRGNPDHRQDPNVSVSGTADTWLPVASLAAASAACRQYIDTHALGGGNWTGGLVQDAAGKVVAEVSYNGRVWSPDGSRDLLESSEAAEPAQAPVVARDRGG